MRAFGWFLLAIAGTLLLAAVVAVPVYGTLHPLQPDWSFNKIASRLWQFSMLAGVAACVVILKLRSRADWGYGLPRTAFLRQWGLGLTAGIATMLPMTAAMLALGVRTPDTQLVSWSGPLLAGLATALAVALVEETFFRGLLFSAVRRESGPRAAIVLTALLYASIHFLARTKVPHAEVDTLAGLRMLAGTLRWFGNPASMIDAWLSLFAVGLLLGMARQWTGSIAACIGLHMGWVWVIKASAGLTDEQPASPWFWLVSEFDGFTGWMVAAWSAVILLLVYAWRARLTRWRDPGSDPSLAPGTERYTRGV